MGHTDRERRGEAGMFESMSYKLFELAGVPASDTNFVHYRVITGASEYGSSQYDGDFWGLYLSIENPDEQFIEEHNLPDGNLYKIESTVPPPGTPNYYEGDLNNLVLAFRLPGDLARLDQPLHVAADIEAPGLDDLQELLNPLFALGSKFVLLLHYRRVALFLLRNVFLFLRLSLSLQTLRKSISASHSQSV